MLGFNDTSTLVGHFVVLTFYGPVNPMGSCHFVLSPEKGRKETEETVEEMKERNREERGTGMKVKK